MKTVTEIDEIKRLKAENKLLKQQQLANEVIDHKIDEVTLRIACRNLGTTPDELKKRTAWDHAHDGIRNEALRVRPTDIPPLATAMTRGGKCAAWSEGAHGG